MTTHHVVSPQLLLVLNDLFESHLWQSYLAILLDAGYITAERFDSLRLTIDRIRSESTDPPQGQLSHRTEAGSPQTHPSTLHPTTCPHDLHATDMNNTLRRMRLQLAIGCCMLALTATQFAWVLLHEGINAHWSHWLLAPWFWQ